MDALKAEIERKRKAHNKIRPETGKKVRAARCTSLCAAPRHRAPRPSRTLRKLQG